MNTKTNILASSLAALLALAASPALAQEAMDGPRPAMAAASPDSSAAPKGAPASPKAVLRRNAEEMVLRVAPERQSELLMLLNEADEERLLSLQGIAKGRAAAILDARPFSALGELVEVKGIGLATFARILAADPNPPAEPMARENS
jgi:DNA uptake protein ComE-like DNA-binding protein